MSLTRVYRNLIGQFTTRKSVLLSQSGSRAKIHGTGEVYLVAAIVPAPSGVVQLLRDDVVDNVLDEGVILKVKADVSDDALIQVTYPDGVVGVLQAWKLKVACIEVIKVYLTPGAVALDQIFLIK